MKVVNTLFIRILSFSLAVMMGGAALAADRVPIEVWSLRQAIQQVEASPDGKYLALMKIESKDGNPVVEIRETANLGNVVRRFNADPMEFTSLTWITDDYLILNARQKIRKKIDGPNQGVYGFLLVGYSVPDKKFYEFDDNTAIAGLLPNEPNKVLISKARVNADISGDDPFAAFRPLEYYIFDINTSGKRFVMKGNNKIAQAVFDDDGNPRAATGYDAGTREFVFYTRDIGETIWSEVARIDSYDQSTFNVAAIDKDNPNKGYLLANNGHDKVGLWDFDMRNGKVGELMYRRDDADILGLANHTDFWNEGSRVTGAVYFGERVMTEFFDAEEKALEDQLRAAISNAHDINITTRSRDGRVMTIRNSGPRDPGSYYLLKDGALNFIGNENPLVRPEQLADVKLVHYTARDGLKIPAYMTVPNSEPPYPTVLLPHGGPYIAESVSYDEWGQVLANNGYLVLQPAFRGSQGWGLAHYEAGLGGEWGGKMQDDKEDAAAWLVSQGFSERDRIAMFGWSYGGYAALAAATRGNNVFQCAIAGAPVADLQQATADFTRGGIPASKDFLHKNYVGVSPEDHADKNNIPLMLIHGDVDQRVPIKHSNQMAKAMDRAGKDYEYVILKGADHFSNTLFQDHQELLYTSMTRFLKEDCGPGGL